MTGFETGNDKPYPVALVGFGEAGMAFTQGWAAVGNLSLSAYDVKTDSPDTEIASAKWAEYDRYAVTGKNTAKEAVNGCSAIFSVVTADQALVAAGTVARDIGKDCFFFDCNSCAPGTKRKSAEVINSAGGRYVDVAVMSPVHPKLHKSPLLISGDHAAAAMIVFECLQMDATLMEGEVGTASSVKMVRSIMMKGLEALFAECVLAGRKAGVDEEVLASLEVTYPGFDFTGRAAYMFERMTRHGLRRAAEMREVALTVDELGLPNGLTRAAVDWQQRMGEIDYVAEDGDYRPQADALLEILDTEKRKEK